MEERERCQCQSSAHGHRPGNCPQPAVDDGLCKECNEENRASEANPYGDRAPNEVVANKRGWQTIQAGAQQQIPVGGRGS